MGIVVVGRSVLACGRAQDMGLWETVLTSTGGLTGSSRASMCRARLRTAEQCQRGSVPRSLHSLCAVVLDLSVGVSRSGVLETVATPVSPRDATVDEQHRPKTGRGGCHLSTGSPILPGALYMINSHVFIHVSLVNS